MVGVRRGKACLELNLVEDVKVKKCFCRCMSKRKTRESVEQGSWDGLLS